MAVSASDEGGDLEDDRTTRKLSDAFKGQKERQIVWVESPTNPTLSVVDIQLIAKVAHGKGALLSMSLSVCLCVSAVSNLRNSC